MRLYLSFIYGAQETFPTDSLDNLSYSGCGMQVLISANALPVSLLVDVSFVIGLLQVELFLLLRFQAEPESHLRYEEQKPST